MTQTATVSNPIQILAVSLRGGELKSIHVPSGKYRELRHLVQLRDTEVKQLTATKCRIKALLLYEGIFVVVGHEDLLLVNGEW